MKRILFCLLLLAGFVAQAQVYNNEWIDHNKTYHKFKVGKTGLHRIPQSVLASAGLSGTPAEYFQLWRNGVQVPIYTSQPTGVLSQNDYIEFWGEMNDGKPDKELYRLPDYQLNDKWSLSTDTSVYFLTVHAVISSNLRLVSTPNNIASNTLSAEPYFMHKAGRYFRDRLNRGRAEFVGELLYSSSYDRGEGWSSNNIGPNGTTTISLSNLFVHSGGPSAKIRVGVSGNSMHARRYKAVMNGDSVVGNFVNYFNYSHDSTNFIFNSSVLSSNTANITVHNVSDIGNMVVHQIEVTYPRQFNFGNANNFEFALPANTTGNYLEITGFDHGGVAPVLYDLTNGKRYVVDISSSSVSKVLLQPSSVPRQLVMVSQAASTITTLTSSTSRNFINYALPSNQGNFLIITNSSLTSSGGSNPVEEYRQYRSSAVGGSYEAKTYLIDDIIDQFGFGIKMSPFALRNFFLFSRQQFAIAPQYAFIIGKGLHYVDHRNNENSVLTSQLNFVPTFGWPASDMLLTADKGDSRPRIPIGRLSVINLEEVGVYLKKIKEFELAQRTPSPFIKDKAWMKNVMHAIGSSEPGLQAILDNYMTSYKNIISDTLFGANVYTFTKTSAESIQQLNSGLVEKLFEDGLSLITYFGHSSANTLEFNLNLPEQYNNQGKYPVFLALGCNAGSFYSLNPTRLQVKETLSEKYVLAADRGTIGFIASTHFGIPHYLDVYSSRAYRALTRNNYGQSLGKIMLATIDQVFNFTSQEDFYARAQCEETALHGDPSIKINPHTKPDYAIEDPLARILPGFVSVADKSFRVSAKFINLGSAINKPVGVEIKREFPDGRVEVAFKKHIPVVKYADSISVDIPINALQDKGLNKITIIIDPDNEIEELYETNNQVTKEVMIYTEEARPVYPYQYAIVNKQGGKLIASTANPFSAPKDYRLEIDTTINFNTPLMVKTVNAKGGIIEFEPGLTYKDNTVYYWRVAPVVGTGRFDWNTSSFIFMSGHASGFNQSHKFQHSNSDHNRLLYNPESKWVFDSVNHNINMRNAVLGTASNNIIDISIALNGDRTILSLCGTPGLVFNIFEPKSFKPVPNPNGAYGSVSNSCAKSRLWNFQYGYKTAADRKKAMDFMDVIPNGYYVAVRNIMYNSEAGEFIDKWKEDENLYGTGNTLYHKLKSAGFSNLDSFYKSRAFAFLYQKGENGFVPISVVSKDEYDVIILSKDIRTPDSIGYITSPVFGPSKAWRQLNWSGTSIENDNTDDAQIDIIGIRKDGSSATLISGIGIAETQKDISNISAETFPYLKLRMRNSDVTHFTPFQLNHWRVTYDPGPEGAVAPNLHFSMRDTFEVGEPIDFKMAFKNIGDAAFGDSVKVRMTVTDNQNVLHTLPIFKHRSLNVNDTLHVRYPASTAKFAGSNILYVEVNPDNDQPEQYRFNNFIYRNFYVKGDSLNPLIDVTFDNSHILNGDIVAAKPDILIKLKDEAKWMRLDDTALVKLKVKFPNNEIRYYNFNTDTLRFNPAQSGTNSENVATVNFKPFFNDDGDYELTVTGQDKSSNQAGVMEYRIGFKVINKPMISNMLNYPNPFTTSTAFVFTITGAVVPQNLKIQILTVTGKIVREITKQELGHLRVGQNITDFKWDGTDQYGQKLANGVYLYRVITNHNGKALDKYKSEKDNTDQYFNKGYGKMYLMR